MLNENEVVEAVCEHLTSNGYDIVSKCSTSEQGIDIEAKHPQHKQRLIVEAKGGTSSRDGSARYGREFTRNQVFDRVAKALYTAAKLRCEFPGDDVIVAFPDTPVVQDFLLRIDAALESLKVKVLLVVEDEQRTVKQFR